jgi:hypothetical protein
MISGGDGSLEKWCQENASALCLALLVALVLLVLCWNGWKLRSEGVGAGGLQAQDNPLVGGPLTRDLANREGFRVPKLEGYRPGDYSGGYATDEEAAANMAARNDAWRQLASGATLTDILENEGQAKLVQHLGCKGNEMEHHQDGAWSWLRGQARAGGAMSAADLAAARASNVTAFEAANPNVDVDRDNRLDRLEGMAVDAALSKKLAGL